MGAVGGSRHYVGGGLGDERGWSCPSCGAENNTPIAGGCGVCGAGKPGYKVGDAPPPPPPAAAERPEPPPAAEQQPNLAQAWIARHPDATLEQAFTAGYVAAYQVARRELHQQAVRGELLQPQPEAPHPLDSFRPEDRLNRTIAAALELFRDQVLSGNPEEVTTGEWCSAAEITEVLRQLHAHLQPPEAAHA